jgi:hypothetical protein
MKHQAIYALYPKTKYISNNIAYDENNNIVEIDEDAVNAKLLELQYEYQVAIETKIAAKESAIAKLTAIGLTADEIAALGVK